MSAKNIEAIYPLSPLQQGMLFHSLYAPDSGVYFGQFHCTLQGEVNVNAIRWAWQRVVDRHPILRTAFVWEGLPEPLQVVGSRVRLGFEEQDWRGLPPTEQQARLDALLQEDRARPFDLTRAPLMRLMLIRLAEDAYHFVWSRPLLLLDGWSVSLLFNEIAAFYVAFCEGRQLSLDRPRAYGDYIAWLQRQDLSRAEAFWRETLKGFAAPTPLGAELPGGLAPEDDGEEPFAEEPALLGRATTEALQALARAHRLTLNVVVQGAWALLLSRYAGSDDVLFGATVSGRPAELEGVDSMIGLFINSVPVRVGVAPEAPLMPWLRELQERQARLLQYEYSPLVQVQKWSEVPPGVPLFESVVIFENFPVEARPEGQDHGITTRRPTLFERTNYPLTLVVEPGPELRLQLLYDRRRFDRAAAARVLGHLRALLEDFVARPDKNLSAFSIATAEEREELLGDFNASLEV
ncbi:MAG TPA: condensation domain-containing protein [Pyrinomonadaceae bacterium]|jgi:hypothetical protein|nr:condensation domain-containing protein [Pyrinomonadaceae bacterium]